MNVTEETPVVHYSSPAIALHWLVGLLLATVAGLGFYMADLPDASPARQLLFDWHRWLGVTAFLLIVLRALWRSMHKPPALVSGMSKPQRIAASVSHLALYVLMIAAPLTGYLLTNSAGEAVNVFDWALPPLIGPDPRLAKLFEGIHAYVVYSLIGFTALHIIAAMKHHFFDRDETLARMIPGLRVKKQDV